MTKRKKQRRARAGFSYDVGAIRELRLAAQGVLDAWSVGDLAAAVRRLDVAVQDVGELL